MSYADIVFIGCIELPVVDFERKVDVVEGGRVG